MSYKPQPIVNKKINLTMGLFVLLGTLIVYYLTFARSLSFWDAGEYITCSSILGVPHPPGNPFYIILGRFFSIIGVGIPHAQIVNFLSSIFSAFAVMFTYFITVKLTTMCIKDLKNTWLVYLAGFLAAMYTAFSFTFWTNAIEAEVYSGLAFILNLVYWLTLIWVEKSEDLSHQNILLLIVYIFFLGFGIHQTSLQIAPAVLFVVLYPMLKDNYKSSGFWGKTALYFFILLVVYAIGNPIGKAILLPDLSKYLIVFGLSLLLYINLKDKISNKTWLFGVLFVIIGLSTHIFILSRAAHRPFINEGYPHNLKLFMDYVLRRQYGTTSMFVRRASAWYQFKEQFLTYFSWQFFNLETLMTWFNEIPARFLHSLGIWAVALLGFGGAYSQFKKNKHSFAYHFAFFFWGSLAMVFVMNLSDTEVRDRDYFFVTAYNYWAIWMAIGSIGLIQMAKKFNKYLAVLLTLIVIGLPVFNLASQYHIHDRNKEYIALGYGQNILNSVEKNAIIFTNGDNDTFPVWYAQAVKDPTAVEYIQPSDDDKISDVEGIISKKMINPTKLTNELIDSAMDFKNGQCYGIRKDVTIANLSLLNTPWYINQLKDHEGVEFNIPAKHIEQCQENPSSVLYPRQLPKDYTIRIKGTNSNDYFDIQYKKGKILYVKDLAVIQIIRDNYGKRPIYFAVTVPDVVGFDEHLRNEGMVDRLVQRKGKNQYNLERLTTNIDSVYTYNGIFDDSIYKDPNMLRLLNNYGAAFIRTSQYFHANRDFDNAIKYIFKGMDYVQEKHRFYPSVTRLHLDAANNVVEQDPAKAFGYLEDILNYDKTNKNILMTAYRLAKKSKNYDLGITFLNKIKAYQDEGDVKNYIELLEEEKEKNN